MLHKVASRVFRQDTVDKKSIHGVVVEIEIHIAAAGLLHHHTLGDRDQTDPADLRILQDFLEAHQIPEQPAQFIHGPAIRQVHAVPELCDRCQDPGDHAAYRGEFFHIPGEELRELEQGQSLSCGSAVHDDAAVLSAPVQVPYLQKGKQVLKPRDHIAVRDLRKRRAAAAGEIRQRLVDIGIFLLHQKVGIQFQQGETGGDLLHAASRFYLKNVSQIMGHVSADQKGIDPLVRGPHCMGGGYTCLAHSALSCDNKDFSHKILCQCSLS